MALLKYLPGKWRLFFRMSGTERRLIFEAALLLGLARLIVLAIPFRFIAPWLACAPETDSCDQDLLLAVSTAVGRAAHHVPWRAVCLPQAMAAKAMLAWRGCGSSFHLGAKFEDRKLIAHAWLIAGGRVVVGSKGLAGMAPLARFG